MLTGSVVCFSTPCIFKQTISQAGACGDVVFQRSTSVLRHANGFVVTNFFVVKYHCART